ncbi:MAG: methyl-accepting chemotaxis protein [Magnetococcus sp. MYC-9]
MITLFQRPRRLGLRAKLSLWSLVAMFWVIGLGSVGLFFIDRVADVSLSLVDRQAMPLLEVGRLEDTLWEIHLREMLHAGLNSVQEMDRLDKELESLSTQLRSHVERQRQDPAVSQVWLARFQELWERFRSIAGQARQLSRAFAKDEAMRLLFIEGNQAFEQVLGAIREEEARYQQQMTRLRNLASETGHEAMRWMAGITLVLGLLVLAGWWYIRGVARSLGQLATDLACSVAQMTATITAQERIIAQQAVSVQETNTTLEALGGSARQSAEQADSAAQGARLAIESAAQGNSRVTETVRSMENTRERMDDMARQIQQLSEQTGRIREITELVSEFANETKLLALNAAVEAVRAGEQGKGFAVLAVETRKLADESKRSVGQINDLVANIQRATQAAVQVAEEGSRSVRSGIAITRNTAKSFQSMGDTVGMASQGAQQISLNVRQQAVAIRQVVEAMQSIHAGAKESRLGITQIKTGIQVLHDAAQSLRTMI